MARTRGGQAIRTGNALEQMVVGSLSAHGYWGVPCRTCEGHPGRHGSGVLIENVPYETSYGGGGRTDFLNSSDRYNLRTRAGCKWRRTAGSADEKFPHAYPGRVEAMAGRGVMILIDGAGYRGEALQELRHVASG